MQTNCVSAELAATQTEGGKAQADKREAGRFRNVDDNRFRGDQ